MSNLTVDYLMRVRDLVQNNWTMGEPAENIGGKRCYCLGGAIAAVFTGDPFRMYDEAMEVIYQEFVGLAELPIETKWSSDSLPDYCKSVFMFNDQTGQQGVLSAVDKAITNLEQNR